MYTWDGARRESSGARGAVDQTATTKVGVVGEAGRTGSGIQYTGITADLVSALAHKRTGAGAGRNVMCGVAAVAGLVPDLEGQYG